MLSNALFWICVYLVGYATTIMVISQPKRSRVIEKKAPKYLVRFFAWLTFIAPPLTLPFTKGPKVRIPTAVAMAIGIILLIMSIIFMVLGQRKIGVSPGLKKKSNIVIVGMYGVVRHPLYGSHSLFAIGWAILFKSLYAFLFSIPYFFLYLPLIYFEERDLLEKYGKKYEEYKKKVKWKMIPKII